VSLPAQSRWKWVVRGNPEMAWVITRLCRDCVDQACVEVCPVDCIYTYGGEDREAFPNQLYIDPEECINCGVCEPECPWEAIFEDEQVPEVFHEDIALNAQIVDAKSNFSVPEVEEKPKPTPEQIAENKTKWGFEG
jgi:ferredoxin